MNGQYRLDPTRPQATTEYEAVIEQMLIEMKHLNE